MPLSRIHYVISFSLINKSERKSVAQQRKLRLGDEEDLGKVGKEQRELWNHPPDIMLLSLRAAAEPGVLGLGAKHSFLGRTPDFRWNAYEESQRGCALT